MLFHENLHKVSGSDPLERQLRRLMPDIHVFGHTHLAMDRTIEGIRYVQWPLGTPREQKGQTRSSSFGLMCLFDSAEGGESPQHWTHWGAHYEEFERDLTKTALPPYVTQTRSLMSGSGSAAQRQAAGGTAAKSLSPVKKSGAGLMSSRGSEGSLQSLYGGVGSPVQAANGMRRSRTLSTNDLQGLQVEE